jgi:hypothetical protein
LALGAASGIEAGTVLVGHRHRQSVRRCAPLTFTLTGPYPDLDPPDPDPVLIIGGNVRLS